MTVFLVLFCLLARLHAVLTEDYVRQVFSREDSFKTKQDYEVSGLPLGPKFPENFSLGYAGLIPIRKGKGEMFFWYFEPQKVDSEKAPLLIWLQGGPGASSMIGLFNLHGPLRINEDFKVIPANFSYNQDYAVLYIDQPVGSGYSYVDESYSGNDQETVEGNSNCYDQEGYTVDQCGVGMDLVEFLVKFSFIFPESHTRPLYLLGESYAGKYLPTFAAHILDHNESSGSGDQFDLRGFAIGDGLTDPETQIKYYGKLALSFGLANPIEAEKINEMAERSVAYAQQGQWAKATSYRNDIFSYYRNITNNVDYYDIRNGDLPHWWSHMEAFLNLPDVKNAVNFPSDRSFLRDPKVLSAMKSDIMKSVVPLFPKFEGRLKMMFFQGQFDFRDGPMSQFDWLYRTFPCLKLPKPEIWMVDGHTSGYRTVCHDQKVSQVTVLQAGHMVSLTQPARGLDLINWFIQS